MGLLLAVAAAGRARADVGYVELQPGVAVKFIPSAAASLRVAGTPAWASGTAYVNGSEVSTNGTVYMCVSTSGTSSATWVLTSPSTYTNGPVMWRKAMHSSSGRHALVIVNASTNDASVTISPAGSTPTAYAGLVLKAGAAVTFSGSGPYDVPQGVIAAYSETNAIVSYVEW